MDRLKCIRSFVQIARSESLSAAARELGVSRSLASQHLKQLEEHLGVRLVNRTTRQIVLTEIGAEYLNLCLDALKGFDEADARISELQSDVRGHIKLMASMAFATQQLTPIVSAFGRQHPEVEISLICFDRSFFAREFIEGGYDLGVSMHPLKEAELISTKVADMEWVPCATEAYMAAHGRPRRPADLAHHACLIHRSHTPEGIWRFDSALGRSEVHVKGPLFSNSSLVLRSAALDHVGIAMLPLYGIREDLDSGRLVRVLPNWRSPTRPAFLVYPQVRHIPRRLRLFIDFVRQELKSRMS
ncbi:MAG TPA: LysR family transcriptional regulator [Stellaceae bacterium]|jgi:DNA-binding transcriptional LysR family regulator|nr:LysR family transcriptional regulator [Stellaceae bacterium]